MIIRDLNCFNAKFDDNHEQAKENLQNSDFIGLQLEDLGLGEKEESE